MRQLSVLAALAALTFLAASCAPLQEAFAPAPNPWPIPRESRVRRDGRLLRVFGASINSRVESEADAKRSLEAWLWTLDLRGDFPQRKAQIEAILNSRAAKPVPSPVPTKSGFTSIIEVDLPTLQKVLGTHYE